MAQRTAGALERSRVLLAPAFPALPAGKTEVVLADNADEANGLATVFPYDAIHLVATPPDSLSELNDFADWLFSLTAHRVRPRDADERPERRPGHNHLRVRQGAPAERVRAPLAHRGHGGAPRVGAGPWAQRQRALRHVRQGHGDRGGDLPLHEVSHPPLDWPLGNMWYLLGGRFLSFLHEQSGPSGLYDFVAAQGRWVWPFAIGVVAEETLGGQDFQALWGEFGEALRTRYETQLASIRQSPVTAPAWITRRGARVLHPRWSPDGSFVAYWDRGLDGPQGIRLATPSGVDRGLAAEIPPTEPSHFARRSRPSSPSRITTSSTGSGATSGGSTWNPGAARASRAGSEPPTPTSDPAEPGWPTWPGSPPERWRFAGSGSRTDGSRHSSTTPGRRIYLPRISPDSRRIAFELQIEARRDVAVWEDGRVVQVTNDDAIDTSPEWLPDGRLLFSSDRTGVYDLYLFEVETGGWWRPVEVAPSPLVPPQPDTLLSLVPPEPRPPIPGADLPPLPAGPGPAMAPLLVIPGTTRRVTNSEMGAMQPASSPDGSQVAYVSYSRAGYDLARLDLSDVPHSAATAAAPRPAGISYDRDPGYPSRPYDPLPMLLPRFWLPVFGWDAAGFTLGALSSASDVVGLHSWAAELRWSFGTASPVYQVAYLGEWLRTPLLLSSSRWINSAPDLTGVYEEAWTPLRASVLVPFRELYRNLSISLGWSGTFFRALNPPPGPLPLQDGFRSMISGSIAYDDTRQFVNSISRVSGFQASVAAGVTSPVLGSDFDYVWGEVSWNGFLRVPWTKQWVLALHLAVGSSQGTFGGQYPFSLGGIPPPDVAGLLLGALGFAGVGAQANQLRGYPWGSSRGATWPAGPSSCAFPSRRRSGASPRGRSSCAGSRAPPSSTPETPGCPSREFPGSSAFASAPVQS